MSVSHDRRSDATATNCPGSVVVGGWLLTLAAVAAFAFTSADTLRDGDATVLVSRSGTSYNQHLSAARPAAPHVIDAGSDGTAAPVTSAVPPGRCGARATNSTTGTAQRISRESVSRSTHVRSGASISRITASACRLSTSPKLKITEVSGPMTGRAAGASRPAPTQPAVN